MKYILIIGICIAHSAHAMIQLASAGPSLSPDQQKTFDFAMTDQYKKRKVVVERRFRELEKNAQKAFLEAVWHAHATADNIPFPAGESYSKLKEWFFIDNGGIMYSITREILKRNYQILWGPRTGNFVAPVHQSHQ